jgi:hypothetical protein
MTIGRLWASNNQQYRSLCKIKVEIQKGGCYNFLEDQERNQFYQKVIDTKSDAILRQGKAKPLPTYLQTNLFTGAGLIRGSNFFANNNRDKS